MCMSSGCYKKSRELQPSADFLPTTVYVNKMSPYSNSNYLSSIVSIV